MNSLSFFLTILITRNNAHTEIWFLQYKKSHVFLALNKTFTLKCLIVRGNSMYIFNVTHVIKRSLNLFCAILIFFQAPSPSPIPNATDGNPLPPMSHFMKTGKNRSSFNQIYFLTNIFLTPSFPPSLIEPPTNRHLRVTNRITRTGNH